MTFFKLTLALIAACGIAAGCATSTPPAAAPTLAHTLHAQGYVALPLRKLATGHETLSVNLNGQPGVFVVDSGAGGSVVHSDHATRFLLTDSVGPTRQGTGAGGNIALGQYAVRSFAIGDASQATPLPVSSILVTNIKTVVDALKAATGAEIVGVIGQDILTEFAAVIDVRGQTLYLKTQPAPIRP
jgi:predicted aspartyl protease